MNYIFITLFLITLCECFSSIPPIRNNFRNDLAYIIRLRSSKNNSFNDLKKVFFSNRERIAFFTFNDGSVDIVTNNISSYYRRLYNKSFLDNKFNNSDNLTIYKENKY